MTDTSTPTPREKTKPDTKYLRDIAIFLTAVKMAKGDLNDLALGQQHLTVLWESIDFINKSEKR
jgi:hypothetical protein